MKNNRFKNFLAAMLTLVMTSMLITPALAASKYETIEDKPVSKKNLSGVRAAVLESIKAQDGEDDFSPAELELMRTALLEMLESNQELSTLLSPQGMDRVKGLERVRSSGLQGEEDEDQFAEIRKQIEGLSSKELTGYRKMLNPTKMRAKLGKARGAIKEHKNSLIKAASDSMSIDSPGLPGIDSYCGAPVPTSAIIAADAIYFIAESVRDIAQDGCNQVLVVLGAGGNGRAACLVTDAVYIIAKAVNQGIHFCDDDYAASVGQASYDRLGHINDDLTDIKANDNTNYTNIIGNAATNTTTITGAVTSAKTDIVKNDNLNTGTITKAVGEAQVAVIKAGDANSAAIIKNDNDNKKTIVDNDNANKDTVVANDNANRVLVITDAKTNRDFLLRTQIEADLSSTDGAVFVAMFLTPKEKCAPVLNDKGEAQSGNNQCGYLDFARAIVAQTIANLAGSNTALATSFLAKGDAYKASGDYKQAYQNYRSAYKTAIK